jgi:hypothetical protein
MGRPLNKKYFGNRNIGTNGGYTADNGIGGEGLASVTTATVGSININNSFPHFPTLTVAAPTLPNGVTATTAITWEIDTVTFDGGGTTYTTGLTTAITGLSTQATVAPVINITAAPGGAPSTYNFTGGSRGEFTSIDATGITTWAVVKGAQTGAQATITFRVKSIAVSNKGSGYTALPSLSWTTLSGTTPSGQTPALTVDTGAVGSVTNQENAILMTARLTGGTAVTVDIIRQVSTSRYKVTDGTRTGIVKLKSAVATAAGEGSIRLLDSDGGTYFATKLTAHKATITRGTGVQDAFPTGAAVKWNMTAATADSLKIDNA